MSLAVGIDVGAYKCAAAVCRPGEREAERKVLNNYPACRLRCTGRVDAEAGSAGRRGGDGVERPLLVRAGEPPAPPGVSGCGVNPLQATYFAKSPL